MRRQVIAVDIDDVLAQSAEGFAAFSNERWGSTITAEQYSEEWAPLWGVSLEEAIARAQEFHDLGAHRTYAPFVEALAVLQHLQHRYDLVIVTSRRSTVRAVTQAWLDTHFAGLFSAAHYVGIWDNANPDNVHHRLQQTKAELCLQIGADYLIDDQPKHCIAAAGAGVRAILFGDYAWNRDVTLPKGATRAQTWQEIKEYFDAES